MMVGGAEPSKWATERFGDLADELVRLVRVALATAVGRQIDAHQAAGLRTLHAYGGAWPAPYEELVNFLGHLDGVEVVRPAGSAVYMVVVNNILLAPFRYAEDLTTELTDQRVSQRLNKTCRALLSQFGPQPDTEQLNIDDVLFPVDDDQVDTEPNPLGNVQPDSMVLVFYSANADAGLLGAGFGEASLPADGSLHWNHIESLPLPAAGDATHRPSQPLSGPRPADESESVSLRRFDEAPLPTPKLSPRPPAEKASTDGPSSEQPPATALTRDDQA
jgi:hypothetical protein